MRDVCVWFSLPRKYVIFAGQTEGWCCALHVCILDFILFVLQVWGRAPVFVCTCDSLSYWLMYIYIQSLSIHKMVPSHIWYIYSLFAFYFWIRLCRAPSLYQCHGCEKRMQTKGERLDGMVFTNADPRYAGKLDDPQGGDTTMLMQQVREVMMVNQQMEDESSWIWLTSEQKGVPLRSEFANEYLVEAGSSKQCNDQRTDQTAFFLAPISTDFIRNTKRELYDKKLEDALEMLDLKWSKDYDTKTQCNWLNTSPLHREDTSNKNGPARVKRRSWNPPPPTTQSNTCL